MQRKLLRIAGFYGMLFATFGAFLAGCVDEPTIEPVDRMFTSTRFVNVCVDVPAVDIWVDSLKFSNIPYKGHYDYTDIPSGTRFLRITKVGADSSEALLRGEVYFRSLTQTSVIVYGRSEVLTPTDSGRIGVTITQERFTYSDEVAKLPPDSGRVKLVNCAVSHISSGKFGQMTLLDTMMVDGEKVASRRIQNVYAPPASASEPPNLSAYVKFPVGEHTMGILAGQIFVPRKTTALQWPWVVNIERKFYTIIGTGLLNDQSTWDAIVLEDRGQ